jgi:hypothetical protein
MRSALPRGDVGRRCSTPLTSPIDDRLDSIGRCRGVLVLPDPHDRPSGVRQRVVVAPVASDIPIELCLPVVAVGARSRAVLWAPVPEAAVDEHGHARTREDDVGATAKALHGCYALSESIPAAM